MSAQSGATQPTGDIDVQHASRLGWRFAQLYHDPHQASLDVTAKSDDLPPHLPSFSDLSPGNRTELILREILHDLTALKPVLGADDDPASLAKLCQVMRGTAEKKAKQAQVLETFRHLRIEIGADDPRLSTGIDLGRALADTVLLAHSAQDYLTEFKSYRLQNVYDWIEDLHTSFPEHAADAVRGSLKYWEQWVTASNGVPPAGQDSHVRRMLTLQGERWRRLLSGEILADDLLTADNYREAASGYLGRIARMTLSFGRRFWPVIVAVLGGTAAIIWAVVTYAPHGPASVAGVIATAAGSLGVSWKTVGSTLGKAAAKAEAPIWDAEVLEAIVMATFLPPVTMTSRDVARLKKATARAKLPAVRPDHQDQPGHPGQQPGQARPAVPPGPPGPLGPLGPPGQAPQAGQAGPDAPDAPGAVAPSAR